MRPSSLGGGRILRRTLSVRLSVRPSRYHYRASRRATWRIIKAHMYFSAHGEGRISYGHLVFYCSVLPAVQSDAVLRLSYVYKRKRKYCSVLLAIGTVSMLTYLPAELRALNHDRPPSRQVRKVLFTLRLWRPTLWRRRDHCRTAAAPPPCCPQQPPTHNVNTTPRRSANRSMLIGWLNGCSTASCHSRWLRYGRRSASAWSRRRRRGYLQKTPPVLGRVIDAPNYIRSRLCQVNYMKWSHCLTEYLSARFYTSVDIVLR